MRTSPQPERLSGLEYSIRADVWSTGLSLLELVQNHFPFSNDLPPIELMIHITQSEVPRFSLPPSLSAPLADTPIAITSSLRNWKTKRACTGATP